MGDASHDKREAYFRSLLQVKMDIPWEQFRTRHAEQCQRTGSASIGDSNGGIQLIFDETDESFTFLCPEQDGKYSISRIKAHDDSTDTLVQTTAKGIEVWNEAVRRQKEMITAEREKIARWMEIIAGNPPVRFWLKN